MQVYSYHYVLYVIIIKKQLYILYLNLMEQLNYPGTVLPPFNLRKIYEMYVARKNLISFDDISLRIPRLSASHLNIRRVIEKKTFWTALRKLLMVIASSLAGSFPNEKKSLRFRCSTTMFLYLLINFNNSIFKFIIQMDPRNSIVSNSLPLIIYLERVLNSNTQFKYRTEADTVLILISNEISQCCYW